MEQKIKYPIGIKLITIISILVLVSLGTITVLVSYFVSNDVRITAEENNHTVNVRSANAASNELDTIRSNVFLLLDMLNAAGDSGLLARQAQALFFERNQGIASIVVTSGINFEMQDTPYSNELKLTNNRFFSSNELDVDLVTDFLQLEQSAISRSSNGETVVLNASPFFNLPVLALLLPWRENGIQQCVVIIFSGESLTETFGSGAVNTSIMINDMGDVLVHPDFELVRAGINLSNLPLVQAMRKNNDTNRQILYTDGDVEFFGAYQKLDIGDLGVLTIIESSIVFENVQATTYRNIYLTISVLCIAILFIWLYSKSISSPLRLLTDASYEIEQGNFDVKLKAKTQDEIGVLTQSFVNMGKGLAERERLKDTFGRFINKEIAEKALRGELSLGGETKECTIFFSDIRGFTGISEKLEPFEVVGFLNDYMTRMVKCVKDTNGVVDKFIGDAVMAVWGAPVSAGSSAQDALNCVRAALMMRAALREFNVGRGGDKKPIIKIGCGINTGSVIAGQIGSSERMEYTVIGDAVNFASRTESLNKPLGTDILITENTYELIKEHLLVEKMPSVTVKGKERPVCMYAVINMPNSDDIPGAGKSGPTSMDEVRELLGIPTPDYKKVNLDEEEKKYKIQS